MYLNAKRYFWHDESELVQKFVECFPDLKEKRIKEITLEAGYWRKANAIHKWFVDNVQQGVDNCDTYEVSREKLKTLLDLVEEVLANKKKAHLLLPTQNGFFFGSTDYDRYYFTDLQLTKTMLLDCLDKKFEGWFFEYHSSW